MKPLLINICLALVWAAMMGKMDFGNLFVGFALGYVILLFQQEIVGESSYFKKVNQFISFVIYFFKELLVASIRVAHDTITWKTYARPGIIALPLDAQSDFEITLFSVIISLTPGTLSLDVSKDRRTLYIHAMFVDDPETLRQEIKNGLERKLLELIR